MAGTIVTMPSNGAADWSSFITIVEKTYRGYIGINLSGLDTASAPTILDGSVVEVNGSIYQFTTAESFTGSIGSGTSFWMTIVPAGTTVTAVFTASAPTWSDTKHGWYDGNDRYIGWARRNAAGEYIYKHFLPEEKKATIYFNDTIDMGAWNMDTSVNIGTDHDLIQANIRTVTGIIRNDADNEYVVVGAADLNGNGVAALWFATISTTQVLTYRDTGGRYDGADWGTAGAFNRGWITINHKII